MARWTVRSPMISAIFNLLDDRAITNFTGSDALYSPLSTGLYQFQAGRQIEGTLQAKF